ncbi:MAG: acetate kinase [Chitinophagaceae bacterium]
MPVNILILNAGSSSLKFQLYEMPSEREWCGGVAERIGKEGSSLHWHVGENAAEEDLADSVPDHAAALQEIVSLLKRKELVGYGGIDLVVHRVVHGGIDFDAPVAITKEVKAKINLLSELAPLHNPVNLRCIEVMEQLYPTTRQFAVFDTSFHRQIPAHAFRYAVSEKFYQEDHIRVYGFHGISHQYVTGQAGDLLENKNAKLISMHLGNGCSICAVQDGRSVDTSMGFSPVSGLVMATRSGDIDASAILQLIRKHHLNADQMDKVLNKQSGLYALCGMTDLRDIHKAVLAGNKEAAFACELYAYRIKKYVGSYAAVMNGVDALIFTGGVGEHSAYIRELVCSKMDWMGIRIDHELNNRNSQAIRHISDHDSGVPILVIPTNEALEMARQVFAIEDVR